MTMRIGVLCPAEIALRRFLPALSKSGSFEYAGIASATPEERVRCGRRVGRGDPAPEAETQRAKALEVQKEWGGEAYGSFARMLGDESVDAVYIPLPPTLHGHWARRAIEAGKHALLEKPFTTSLADTEELLSLASERGLAVQENYMFQHHSQIEYLRETVASGAIGDFRLARVDFGFPFRGGSDFRYDPEMGGGALLDAGGYTVKLASLLLGPTARVTAARLSTARGLPVDVYGSATLENDEGAVCQVAFGMDNEYRCDVDVWGSGGSLTSGRILTAPPDLAPVMRLRRGGATEDVELAPDDSFLNSIEHFAECVRSEEARAEEARAVLQQARLVEDLRSMAAGPDGHR